METTGVWEIVGFATLTWLFVFSVFLIVGFAITFFKGRKGAYREKLWDARREIEGAANTEVPDVGVPHGYQPKPNSIKPRSPGDE